MGLGHKIHYVGSLGGPSARTPHGSEESPGPILPLNTIKGTLGPLACAEPLHAADHFPQPQISENRSRGTARLHACKRMLDQRAFGCVRPSESCEGSGGGTRTASSAGRGACLEKKQNTYFALRIDLITPWCAANCRRPQSCQPVLFPGLGKRE